MAAASEAKKFQDPELTAAAGPRQWILEVLVGGTHPVVFVEHAWTAKQARTKILAALRKRPRHGVFEHLLPYAFVTTKMLVFEPPPGLLYFVWDGTYGSEDGLRGYSEHESIFDAVENGYLLAVPRSAQTLMFSSGSLY
jgi:hypothetical protein